jgi:hypothetical protein
MGFEAFYSAGWPVLTKGGLVDGFAASVALVAACSSALCCRVAAHTTRLHCPADRCPACGWAWRCS